MIDESQIRLSLVIKNILESYGPEWGPEHWIYDMMVRQRIACEQRQYPPSEALYWNIQEWEQVNGMDFEDYLREQLADAT